MQIAEGVSTCQRSSAGCGERIEYPLVAQRVQLVDVTVLAAIHNVLHRPVSSLVQISERIAGVREEPRLPRLNTQLSQSVESS